MSLPALSEWLHVAMTELCFGELVSWFCAETLPSPAGGAALPSARMNISGTGHSVPKDPWLRLRTPRFRTWLPTVWSLSYAGVAEAVHRQLPAGG